MHANNDRDEAETRTSPTSTQNARATIGFVIYYPFQYFVYKNIFKHLARDAEFIIDLRSEGSGENLEVLRREIESLLSKHGVKYRVFSRDDYRYPEYARRFFSKYTALVSVWERGCMVHPATQHARKINVLYGAGKYLTLVRPSRGIYDIVLSFGKPDALHAGLFSRTEVVGNPRFDDWHTNTLDSQEIERLRSSIDPSKPTVVYLPTHSDLSSVDVLADELESLAESFNVLLKAHYYLAYEEPERWERLSRGKIHLFNDSTDLLPLLRIADVVLSDNSSAIFDAMLADTPVLVADFWDAEYLDIQHKEPVELQRGFRGAITYSDSVEQIVKREGWVPTLKRGESLQLRLEEAIRDTDFFKKKRKELSEELFAFRDGASGERAATAIRRELLKPRSFTRPIVHHAFEAFMRRLGAVGLTRERQLQNEIALYKRLANIEIEKRGQSFSVILLEIETAFEQTCNSLRSLAELDFPKGSYEVVLVESDAKRASLYKDTFESFASGASLRIVDSFAEAIRESRSTYIACTKRGYIVPSTWLSAILDAYERNQQATGVGGFVGSDRDSEDVYDVYTYVQLATELGIRSELHPQGFFFECSQRSYGVPTGTLCNMSYPRVFVLELLSELHSTPDPACLLKILSLQKGPHVFLPLQVTRSTRMSLGSFARDNMQIGFSDRYYRTLALSLRLSWHKTTTISLLHALRIAWVRGTYGMPLLVLVSRVARTWGSIRARVLRTQRMFEVFRKEKAALLTLSETVD